MAGSLPKMYDGVLPGMAGIAEEATRPRCWCRRFVSETRRRYVRKKLKNQFPHGNKFTCARSHFVKRKARVYNTCPLASC